MKKIQLLCLGLAAAILVSLSGCSKNNIAAAGDTPVEAGTYQAAAETIDIEFTARDLDVGFDENTDTSIILEGSGASVSGSGDAEVSGSTVTIRDEGTYIVSGNLENGQLIVDAADTDKIQIVLKDAQIHCETHAAIYIKKADKVFITLAEGSENTLTDGAAYTQSDDTNVDGVIYSKADLTINGSGKLLVTGSYKHGIVSKDDLVITGGDIAVTALQQGLHGKDCVKIKDGTFTLHTGGDAIQSDNAENAERGYVYIAGGSFAIEADTDGIQAETVLRIDGGSFQVTTGGGSANASADAAGDPRSEWGRWGGPDKAPQDTSATEESTETTSAKGLKAGKALAVNQGNFTIDSSDDALHSNGDLAITGGELSIATGDDGVHADGAVTLTGGSAVISKSYEGIEGQQISISAGAWRLTCRDDGLNAAGGSDGSSLGGRPGQNAFEADMDCFIRITGGELTVDASGDGIDSNGALTIVGGTIYVDGPTSNGNGALDYAGEASISGGVIVAVGSAGMAQGFSEASTQGSILYNLEQTEQAGSTVTLADAAGNILASYTPAKQYQSIVVSAPGMEKGGTYVLTAGDQSAEITLDSIVFSSGGAGGMGPGSRGPGEMAPDGMGGGMDGRGDPGQRPQRQRTQ